MTKKTSANKGKEKSVQMSASELSKLARQGTKEAIARIEKYLNAETDAEKKYAAKEALKECAFKFYEPKNDKEGREFTLSRLIIDRKGEALSLMDRIVKLEAKIDKFRLEQDVHKKVLSANKDRKEDWKYRYIDDIVSFESGKLAELKDDLEYSQAWIKTAEKMITTPRYKGGIPEEVIEQAVFDFDDDSYDELDSCCTDGCDCDENDCCGNGLSPESMGEIPF